MRARGLKWCQSRSPERLYESRPHAGAWIEILRFRSLPLPISVAPPCGRVD